MNHSVSKFCKGEFCGPCYRAGVKAPATHKIGEEIPSDDPMPVRHNLTQYVCCSCYSLMMGPRAQEQCGSGEEEPCS